MEAQRPRVGVGVIVRRGAKVLLGKRKGAHGSNTWCFPGGHLEFMESVVECAEREVSEESGVTIENIETHVFTNDLMEDDGKHYVTLYAVCDWVSGEAKVLEPEKCEMWEWYEWESLPRPLFMPIENLLKSGFNPFN